MPKFSITCTDKVLASDESYVRLDVPGGKSLHFRRDDSGDWSSVSADLAEPLARQLENEGWSVSGGKVKKPAAPNKDGE